MGADQDRRRNRLLLKDEPGGAAGHVRPMLDLPAGLRISTVTGWLADLDRRLAGDRYAQVPAASDLRLQIREFTTEAHDIHAASGKEAAA